jgi:ABC-type nitrate/sulfonate/bicarbonate transport system permease component
VLPEILVGMRIAIGFGWTTLVAAEMVAANVGLGQMVLNASNFLRTDIVIMGIVVIGVVAYAFDLLMRWVERRLVPWRGGCERLALPAFGGPSPGRRSRRSATRHRSCPAAA